MDIDVPAPVARLARAGGLLLFGATLVFLLIHLGPAAPANQTHAEMGLESEADLDQKKLEYGLTGPLSEQYADYLWDMATLEFGDTWVERHADVTTADAANDVNAIVTERAKRTGWLWLWTATIAIGITIFATAVARYRDRDGVALGTALAGTVPAFLLALLLETAFANLGRIAFGLDWQGFLSPTPAIARPIPVADVGTVGGFRLATKLAIPPALALAIPVASILTVVTLRSDRIGRRSNTVDAVWPPRSDPVRVDRNHRVPDTFAPALSALDSVVVVLVGSTVLVESVFRMEGLGSLLYSSIARQDYTTLQATMFVFLLAVVAAVLLRDVATRALYGAKSRESRDALYRLANDARGTTPPRRIDRPTLAPISARRGIRAELRRNLTPVLLWLGGGVLLLALEVGAVVDFVQVLLSGSSSDWGIPTLLDRGTVPNAGHRSPGGGWAGTFLGLPPAFAWAVRVAAVYLYAFAWVGWIVAGYRIYRTEYRSARRTKTDEFLARFRASTPGMAGLSIVFVLVVAAVFAPTIALTPLEQNHAHTSLLGTEPDFQGQSRIAFLDRETGTVETTTVRDANFDAASNPQSGVGPLGYDAYDRFHPLGTTTEGTDYLTELLHGLRIYFVVAGAGAVLAGLLTAALAVLTRSGRRRAVVGAVGDSVSVLPTLPFVLLVSTYFYPEIRSIAIQLLVWTLLLALLGSVRLWRIVRPLVERPDRRMDVDRAMGMDELRVEARAARRTVERIAPPLVVYGLTSFCGFVITISALSFLGHSTPSVPPYGAYEWGTFLWLGENARLSESGHLFVVPAIALVTLLSGAYFLALGLRESLDVDDRLGITGLGELTKLGGGG